MCLAANGGRRETKLKFETAGGAGRRRRRRSLFVFMDTIEGPRAPAVTPTAHHSSLTRVRAAPLSPW